MDNMEKCYGTHAGPFHADDVFAWAVFTSLEPGSRLVRTRDPRVLEACHVVFDVGGVYNPDGGRFDHHQVGKAGTRPNGVEYSSFGLVWRHVGAALCNGLRPSQAAGLDAAAVADRVDRALVQAVDAMDNGQDLELGGTAQFPGAEAYSLSAVISSFVPSWHEGGDMDAAFRDAAAFAASLLLREIAAAWGEAMAASEVSAAIAAADAKGSKVVQLDRFVPWAQQITNSAPDALFVIFPSEGLYMVQAVGTGKGFESRKLLPQAWAGLRDGAFVVVSGAEDGVFCHPNRFIAGARTLASAIRLAEHAVGA